MCVDLIQLKHIYSSKEGEGQIYLPTSLLTAGARLNYAGIQVNLFDENIRQYTGKAEIIGISLLGAPYIWKAIQFMRYIRRQRNNKIVFLLGGQVINGLLPSQFERLFGKFNAINGNIDNNLAELFNFNSRLLSAPESTSLIDMYQRLDDTDMYKYLSNEFSFYVSQGCKFSCEFCAAVRTRKNCETGKKIYAKEVYRDFSLIQRDLSYLIKRAKALHIDELKIYLSNLDVFQTPVQLYEFAKICNMVKKENPGFVLRLRGLSCPDSFLKAISDCPDLMKELTEAGLESIGFGIDGMTPEVWKGIRKGHNTEKKCIEAIELASLKYNITPELLMTFGHNDVDNEKSLMAAYEFTKQMIELYGAIPRPHIAKSFIPGNDGWFDIKNRDKVETLMKNPFAFQSLDFTALPTSFTHSNKEIRTLSKKYFLKMCALKGNTTQYVKSFTPRMSKNSMRKIETFNLNRFDR